ncbi:MAG: hypothetical protein AB7U73_17195 [Pirellulales bacterium]
MSRTTLNFLLDCLLLLFFLALIWVTFVLRVAFPNATAAAGYRLWGFSYDGWAGLQFALFVVLIAAVLLHIMLHWSWVCGVIANRVSRLRGQKARLDDGSQTIYGVAALIVVVNVLGVALAVACLSVQMP